MHRASLKTTSRHASHRVWKADLARACADYHCRSSKRVAHMSTTNEHSRATRSVSGVSDVPPHTETITTITEGREMEKDSFFAFFMGATTAGAMLGTGLNPISGVVLGAACGAMALSFLEMPTVKRTSVVTRPSSSGQDTQSD